MTWDAFHRRGAVLRAVVAEAEARRDGTLPLHVPGATTAFRDELDLAGALQLHWHTRLSGHLERALAEEPAEPETAVIAAWRRAAEELAGVRLVLDRCAEQGPDRVRTALARARAKERVMLAVLAGRTGFADPAAGRIGRDLERAAREATPVPA